MASWGLLPSNAFQLKKPSGRGPNNLKRSRFSDREGQIQAVLDVTTTELADELLGGKCSAGPNRLEKAGEMGTPQVVVPGAMDMVNYFPEAIPPQFRSRLLYTHNPATTLMRTNVEENRQLGEIMAKKLFKAKGPSSIYIPLGGFSAIDAPGQPFFDPEANHAFIEALKKNLPSHIPVIEKQAHINAPSFAGDLARALLELLRVRGEDSWGSKR